LSSLLNILCILLKTRFVIMEAETFLFLGFLYLQTLKYIHSYTASGNLVFIIIIMLYKSIALREYNLVIS